MVVSTVAPEPLVKPQSEASHFAFLILFPTRLVAMILS